MVSLISQMITEDSAENSLKMPYDDMELSEIADALHDLQQDADAERRQINESLQQNLQP